MPKPRKLLIFTHTHIHTHTPANPRDQDDLAPHSTRSDRFNGHVSSIIAGRHLRTISFPTDAPFIIEKTKKEEKVKKKITKHGDSFFFRYLYRDEALLYFKAVSEGASYRSPAHTMSNLRKSEKERNYPGKKNLYSESPKWRKHISPHHIATTITTAAFLGNGATAQCRKFGN